LGVSKTGNNLKRGPFVEICDRGVGYAPQEKKPTINYQKV
jgi:hypothetical protein